jgi:hypothetical protein
MVFTVDGAILSGSMSGIFVNYKRVTMKSQTLTAGSNIDHMTASHDRPHDCIT